MTFSDNLLIVHRVRRIFLVTVYKLDSFCTMMSLIF
jgi:hypothetical protein